MTRDDSQADEQIVYLATVPNEPLAQLWTQVLEDEGIQTMMKALGPGIGAWFSNATFEHELYVRASDLDRARQVIDELETEPLPDEDAR